jgi:hypothetical protein
MSCRLQWGNSCLQFCISEMLLDKIRHTVFQNERFKVLMLPLMMITTFCNMTPCTLVYSIWPLAREKKKSPVFQKLSLQSTHMSSFSLQWYDQRAGSCHPTIG